MFTNNGHKTQVSSSGVQLLLTFFDLMNINLDAGFTQDTSLAKQ